MKKLLLNPWFALLTLFVLVYIRIADPMFVESVRLRYFDTVITSAEPQENNIYTVNIDEAALAKYGQWPWSRDVYAELIEDLYKRNAGIVVWNVLMPESDRAGKDAILSRTMSIYPVILNNVPSTVSKNEPKEVGATILRPEFVDRLVTYPGIVANVPLLEKKAVGSGVTNTLPEVDGVNRRLPLVVNVDDQLYPSVALETLRVLAGDPGFQIKLSEYGVEKLRVPKFGIINTDSLGRIWIDWSQRNRSVSAVDLPNDFNGAIVIVGASAVGIANPVPTAAGAMWPQDVQAAVISTLANGVNIERPDWADGAEILALVLLGLLIIFVSRWTYVGIIICILIVSSIVPGSFIVFSEHRWLIDTTAFVVSGGILMLHVYGVKFVSEYLQKLQIKRQFGSYLSPKLVERLQKNPELLALGGESRELSIMFTDVRGFTAISEHYGTNVQGLTQIMNRYMTAMTASILKNEGTLDKYIGDAQMAFWNAPLDDPAHAKNAVRTALEMMENLNAFNKEIAAEGIPPFGMGIGINTDTVVVGNMGSSQRFDYTCLGDGVNLASRLEGQSKNYGVGIVLGTNTAEKVKDTYTVIELDNIAVKGKTQGVKIYTVGQTINYMHDEYLKQYYAGNWLQAIKIARKFLVADNVDIKNYYEIMIKRMEEGLPPNWDGIYRATSK
jgi:adenylate cyclase